MVKSQASRHDLLTMGHHLVPSPPTQSDRRNSKRHQVHSHWDSGQTRPWPSVKTKTKTFTDLNTESQRAETWRWGWYDRQSWMKMSRSGNSTTAWSAFGSRGDYEPVTRGHSVTDSVNCQQLIHQGAGVSKCKGLWTGHLLNCKSTLVTDVDKNRIRL